MRSSNNSKKTLKASPLLLLDLGNTSVTYGIYKGGRLLSFGHALNYKFPNIVKKWSKSGSIKSYNVLICSVIPNLSHKIEKMLSRYLAGNIWIVARDVRVSIKHKYLNINKLGSDRKINIYGALQMYKPPFLVITIGTAMTVDYVSKKRVFEGGMIIPGPETAYQALLNKTALLPKKFTFPKRCHSLLGRSTKDCLASGILEGYGSMTDEIVRRIKDRRDSELRVIATGGLAATIKPYTRQIDILDMRHTLKSLVLLFKNKIVTS